MVEVEKDGLVGRISYHQLYRHADYKPLLLMALGSLSAGVAGCTRPLMTLIFAGLVDAFTEYQRGVTQRDVFEGVLETHVLYFVYLAVGMFITSYLQMLCWDLSSNRQTNLIRTLYLTAILRQSRSFFDTHNAGELSSRLTSDMDLIQNGIGEKVGMFVQAFCTLIAALVIAFVQSWRVTLVLCGLFPLMGACNVICNRMAARYGIGALKAYAEANNVVEEALSSIRTVMSLGAEQRAVGDFTERLETAEHLGSRKAKAQGLGTGGVQLCMYLAYSIAFFYGSFLIVGGELTPGRLVAVYFALVIGTMRMSSIAPEIAAFGNACSAAYAIFHLIDREPDIARPRDPTAEPLRPGTIVGRLSFEGVQFKYPSRPDVVVLDDVSFQVEPGKTVALVGQSGSGKSTIVALLERWYEPLAGKVSVDGHELRDLDMTWWRQQIGFVSQEPVLFDLTISENVALGAPADTTPSEEDIIQACKMANAHTFIEKLPDGYNTLVGERGALLSGGQKQRIAIARALIRNPKILLLDEATSALDSTSEKLVQDALERASIGRTTVVVAHRLSTIRNADTIIVMNKGHIIEEGNHRMLVERNGVYKRLVDMQQVAMDAQEDDDKKVPVDYPNIESDDQVESEPTRNDEPDLEKGSIAISEVSPHTKAFYSRILALHRPELSLVTAGVICAILGGAIFPTYAVLYGYILQVFTLTDLSEMRRQANHWAAGFLVIAVVAGIANYGVHALFGCTGERVTSRLRSMTFAAMLKQEPGWFDREENRTGVLVSRIASDTARVNVLVGSVMGTLVQLFVNIFGGLVVAFVTSWKVTVVTMTCIPLLIFAGMMQMASLKGFGTKTKKAHQKAAHVAIQAMQHHGTVQSLGRETTFLDKYNDALAEPIAAAHRQAYVTGLGYAASNGLGFLANALAFWYGGTLFAKREIDMRQMFTVMIATVFGSMASGRASGFAPDIAKAKHSARDLFSVLDRHPRIDASLPGTSPTSLPSYHISLRNVWFAYPTRPTQMVLRGLDLDIEPGTTVALVGGSGSGKSTIVGLLERFYDPLHGDILVDGHPLASLDLPSWRQQIGYVGQEPILFDTSIRDNITYGSGPVSDEVLLSAAEKANVHEFVSALPLGYDTRVGSKATQLSGGQRQRIAIARALIRNPRILLLDEATSALDSHSEKLVQEALDRVMHGRTAIVVAHRLSTIQNADKIVVMDSGAVVEVGTHSELVALGGVYKELVGMQSLDV
ncbi:uncharacterized protein SPPG_05810 [Spizellomyces punctatus DAOM BR117]|uniref:Uncharacterized protein n=2 Tax=Spizellomyces punctatus (strain DAOM BR117) TaxID=645134 RepID=A0A0L0HCW3_SPIPD|nr:uncharacterized protein SPPG_05810 [Spizellomyces punctatus DAOM BR117]KNC98836.1 hypothetical protein SPPG_05810 [Spizellomyces punctatus DAOM BR117]|eukprot:XP_016606876.1 hypothetical protein SPPG_05810 [Spizellomyces punctatus DAOM BR117]